MRLLVVFIFISTILFGQRKFVRNEKVSRYGYLRETNYYDNKGVSEAEITWRDSITSKVVQYSKTFMIFGDQMKCLSAECIKYKSDTTLIIKSNKSGKTVEQTFIKGKLIRKRNLNQNSGCEQCYDPVKGI